MGNASGREDGLGSSSGIDEGVGGGGDGPQDSMAGPYEARSYYDHAAPPPEAIALSPPTSPRATQSPLMFSPQVPIAPLQRPDEMHVSTRSRMENSQGYDDMCAEHVIPTMITWSYGGKEVEVEGSWDNWRVRMPLERSGKDFTIMKVLPSGVYQYRFIVDGQWKYAPDLPWAQDGSTPYNILDLQDSVPEDLESISSFVPPESPDSSYSNLFLGAEDFAKEPPMVPPHLQVSLLNIPCVSMEIPALTRPPHVVLNHLYMHKGKTNPAVVALGSTNRFLAKYVTVVLYKPLHTENQSLM